MQKIVPHLWYDKEAAEAAKFYVDAFGGNSKITSSYVLKNTPSGSCDVLAFELFGYQFMSISAGPYFKVNPSISFMINFDPSQDPEAKNRIDEVWKKLVEGGKILMPLDKYPFSERYGWVQDKYGVSWQLIFSDPQGEVRPSVIPALLFVEHLHGKAEEARNFYQSVFKNAKGGGIARYGAEQAPDTEGTVMFSDFMLEGQWFAAMDSAREHGFAFNEAISFMINCKDQGEIDYYWEKLSADPKAEQCGWLKDKFGVSWQVIPHDLEDRLRTGSPEQVERLTEAFLKMKKFDLAELDRAYAGK